MDTDARGFFDWESGSAPASGAANGGLAVGTPTRGARRNACRLGCRVRRGARRTAAEAAALPIPLNRPGLDCRGRGLFGDSRSATAHKVRNPFLEGLQVKVNHRRDVE